MRPGANRDPTCRERGTLTTENKVVEILRGRLAQQLNLEPEERSQADHLEAVNWPDACLGAPNAGRACAAVVTPGFRVILSAGENHYTYHTDLTGSSVRLETAGASRPSRRACIGTRTSADSSKPGNLAIGKKRDP